MKQVWHVFSRRKVNANDCQLPSIFICEKCSEGLGVTGLDIVQGQGAITSAEMGHYI